MTCGVGGRRGSSPALLWLWCRPVATAPIRPLAWEPPYAASAAPEVAKRDQKKKKKKERKRERLPMLDGVHSPAQHALILFSFPEKCFWKWSVRSQDTVSIRTWTRSRSQRRSSGGKKIRYVVCPWGRQCQLHRPVSKSYWSLIKGAWLVSDIRERWNT